MPTPFAAPPASPAEHASPGASTGRTDDSLETEDTDDTEEKTRAGIQSIEVGFRLLDVLTREPRAMMLRDLAGRAGMSPAKAHRYLVSFQRLGVVAQDPLTGRYELGGFALQMGLARLARVDGVKLAHLALAELHERLDATLGIAVWGNQGPTVVHWAESSRPAKAALKLGDVMPLLSSATGLLFAAYLPRGKTQALIERELADARHSPHAALPRTQDEVERLLADVRSNGAARVEGMLVPTIDAFCMPVFDATGALALGIIALGQEGVFDIAWDGTTARALRACAEKLSYELGYSPSPH
ncbi:IclR family transcriptional regulator [Trinickia sp. LjRoot230]|uniref:IclR family transcriptional regulator n=1 Tax=Trinickia sp. LjRoot230 TaxID=3342288 RepID=UPI003ED01779